MTFWKPGAKPPMAALIHQQSEQLDREVDRELSGNILQPAAKAVDDSSSGPLPIGKLRREIVYCTEHFQVVVIVGETGSGKTTQIPQYLYRAFLENQPHLQSPPKMIGITQPRRVAATSVARRVAQEMGSAVGKLVGYTIRFDDQTELGTTRIKYMTDGILIREMMLDPLLTNYAVIMVDEAHERSLLSDVLLGLLKKVLRRRPDLRLIVSSATIDAVRVRDFFDDSQPQIATINNANLQTETSNSKNPAANADHSTNATYQKKDVAQKKLKLEETTLAPLDTSAAHRATIMSVPGRMFGVDVHFTESPVEDYLDMTVQTVLAIHKNEAPGDILCFLTGQEEIDRVSKSLRELVQEPEHRTSVRLMVVPLFGGLAFEKQMEVFDSTPAKARKVVLSTNIAETSVTIGGIVYVVDCGFVKIKMYNPLLGLESLVVVPVSQAQAQQRTGRAGRVQPGKCYRLYTEETYQKLAAESLPEMQRCNLMPVILQLKALGIDNILSFDFLSPPPLENMVRALELLYALGALDDDCALTSPHGLLMAEFPVEPLLAKVLVSSGHEFRCSEEMISIAAMCTVQNVFVEKATPQHRLKFAVYEGDHISLLNCYLAWKQQAGSSTNLEWCASHGLNYRALHRAREVRRHLKRYFRRFGVPLVSCNSDPEPIRKCLISGLFANAATFGTDACYRSLHSQEKLWIHPHSVLFNKPPKWLLYGEVTQTSGKTWIRDVLKIDPRELLSAAPHYYQSTNFK